MFDRCLDQSPGLAGLVPLRSDHSSGFVTRAREPRPPGGASESLTTSSNDFMTSFLPSTAALSCVNRQVNLYAAFNPS